MAFLLCVRHGETDWNRQGRWQGHSDQELNAEGTAQAEAVALALAAEPLVAIVSSDLRRSTATAAPLAERLGLPVVRRRDLREVDVGSWAGLTREEAFARDPSAAARHAAGLTGWTDGETYEAMMDRARRVANELADEYAADARVAVFTHGGIIRALAALAVGISSSEARRRIQHVEHASITELRVLPSSARRPWRLVRFNQSMAAAAMPATGIV